jgi:hypothetical protein
MAEKTNRAVIGEFLHEFLLGPDFGRSSAPGDSPGRQCRDAPLPATRPPPARLPFRSGRRPRRGGAVPLLEPEEWGSRRPWGRVAALKVCTSITQGEPRVAAVREGSPGWSGTTPSEGLDQPCGGYRGTSLRLTLLVTDPPTTRAKFSMSSDQSLLSAGGPGPEHRQAFGTRGGSLLKPEQRSSLRHDGPHGLSGGGRA